MSAIIINDTLIPTNQTGLFDLDAVFNTLDTDQFKQTSTQAGRASFFPHQYLSSDSALVVARAVVESGRPAFVIDESPNGGAFVCTEVLLDYARRRNATLFVDLIRQLLRFDSENYEIRGVQVSNHEMNVFINSMFEMCQKIDNKNKGAL